MHPICTCSCLFTPLTEGRSARDLTQSQKKRPNFRAAALNAFDLPDAAITDDKQVIMPWANRILPAAMLAHNIPAEEEDTASVISVASSGAAAQKRATETDSDASQASKDDAQTEVGSIEEVPTDEDESEPESEEEFELSEKEQRLLHEAYDTYATTGQQWTRERQSSSANCRTSFADAGNVRSVVEKLTDLPDSWPLMRILIPLDGLSLQKGSLPALPLSCRQHTWKQRHSASLSKESPRSSLRCYLAGEVASILSPVAAIGHREMVAPMYHPLLTPGFWVRPIYMELLHASSRLRRDTRVETARPSTGLVKILCTPKAQKEGPMNATLHNKGFAHRLEQSVMHSPCMSGCLPTGPLAFAPL